MPQIKISGSNFGMQTTISASNLDINKTMQPQSAQNMFVSPTVGNNNNGSVRSNTQTSLYRGPPSNTGNPNQRGNPRHVAMYPQSIPQIPISFSQYTPPRQPTFQAQQFHIPQQMHQFQYQYQYFPVPSQPPPPQGHQRGAVAVGTAMAVPGGPSNVSLNGPSIPSQNQGLPITAGTMLSSAGSLPPGTVVTSSAQGQAVGVPTMVGVVPGAPAMSSPPTQTNKRYRHRLEIIDPSTNKNILDDLDLEKNSTNTEVEDTSNKSIAVVQPSCTIQPDPQSLNYGSGVMGNIESRSYIDSHHQISIQNREALNGQTPVVSAISDSPSVEILPAPQKPRSKKILQIVNPKDLVPAKPTENEDTQQLLSTKINQPILNTTISNAEDTEQQNIQQEKKQPETLPIQVIENSSRIISTDVSTPLEVIDSSSTTSTVQVIVPDVNENINIIDSSNCLEQITQMKSDDLNVEFLDNKNENSMNTTSLNQDANCTSSDVSSTNKDEFINSNKMGQEQIEDVDELDRVAVIDASVPKNTDITLKKDTNEDVADTKHISSKTDELKIENNSQEVIDNTTESDSIAKNSEKIDIISRQSVPQSLISYNDGQWSPNNPSGKKQYNREQLLQLREAKASRIQPGVTNTAILPQPTLLPQFVRANNKRVQSMMGSIGGGGGGNRSMKGSMIHVNLSLNQDAKLNETGGRNSMKGGMIHVNLSLNQDVKLNETDNAWRPRALASQSQNENVEEPGVQLKREKDELLRNVRGILNKLTPEKFDKLVEEIIKLKIDTPDKMESVMVLVFEKAIDEPNFSVSYARLCHRLITEVKARDERMESGTKMNLAHFRNALLDKTEREFTQNVTQKDNPAKEKLKPIIEKIKKCLDPIEKAELEAQLEEEERKIRRRSGGTVRFIGELFKISMLTGKIIYTCVDALLDPNNEDMLECLCKLLTTVGSKLEQTQIKETGRYYTLDNQIGRMQAIAQKTDGNNKVSSRVRFMLQDVIDLRKNKWQSKKNEAPKTMGQIEKEVKTEQLSSQYLNYNSGMMSNSMSGGQGSIQSGGVGGGKRNDDHRGSRYNEGRSSNVYGGSLSQRSNDGGSLRRQGVSGNGNHNNNNSGNNHSNVGVGNNNEDTWQIQTSKGRSQAVDTNKLEAFLNQNQDITQKKMGGVSQFIWQSAQTAPQSNSFAVLSSLGDNSNRNDHRGDRSSVPRSKGSYHKGSMERDRYNDKNVNNRSGNSSSGTSRENSSSRNNSQAGLSRSNTLNASSGAVSSIQKSTNQSKYSQQQQTQINRTSGKSSSSGIQYISRNDLANSTNVASHMKPNDVNKAIPKAILNLPTVQETNQFKSILSELFENVTNTKNLNDVSFLCVDSIVENQWCGLFYYIFSDYLHLRQVGYTQRRHLANITIELINRKYLTAEHLRVAYQGFSELVADLVMDIPELWLYILEFCGPLLNKNIIAVKDLWTKQIKEQDPSMGQKFLKTFLSYCTQEIGPNFTRQIWKDQNLKWTDFISERDMKKFIQLNNFEWVENVNLKPHITNKDSRDNLLKHITENVGHLLEEESTAEKINDYINGNIVNIDKQFIRVLTETLCNYVIIFVDSSYKLDTDKFTKICIPVLTCFINSVEERELECLYTMQLLVHNLEHPRGLLSDLFGELYESDIIPQDSFVKWRDSKEQSAGKGVAVKGLNPFFNHVLSEETSDENN